MDKPTIEVGIMSAKAIQFKLNGVFKQTFAASVSGLNVDSGEGKATVAGEKSLIINWGDKQFTIDDSLLLEPQDEAASYFELYNVVIGVQFHWEREENQRFKGKLKLFVENGQITAVNILSLEDYLLSVISSEMSAASSLELLKAHAVISRSWLLAQIEKGKKLKNGGNKYQSLVRNDEGYIRWYDREDHDRFDVCADDHCQRYQGIARITSTQVCEALQCTSGEVLMYDGVVCDARFYKSCGGVTEKFENVWEPVNHPYLTKVIDNPAPPTGYDLDLTQEENARKWILSAPPAFCNTRDKEVLSQVLNDYDLETQHFYRWEVVLAAAKVKELLQRKVGIDVGDVLALEPVERGVSGRLIRLKIVGSMRSIIIGKELEIRKALSESHLYSSAFIVEKTGDTFVLKGAGWGHGVGLCQIGAAIMGDKGYSYQEILAHYFPEANLHKLY